MVLSIFNSEKRPLLTLLVVAGGVLVIVVLNLILFLANVHSGIELLEEKRFYRDKILPRQKYDLVFLGDSRCLIAMDPTHFEKVLGLKAYNCSFAAGGLTREIFLHVEKKVLNLEKGREKIIVLGITHRSLTETARANPLFHQSLQESRMAGSSWSEMSDLLFRRIKSRDVKSLFKKKKPHKFYHKNGWMEVTSEPREKSQRRNLESFRIFFKKAVPSRKSVEEICCAVADWRKKGIRVFAFRPPTMPAMDALEDEEGKCNMGELRRHIERAGGIWLEAEDRNKYTAYDASHLNSREAAVLSGEFAEKIKNCLRQKTSSFSVNKGKQ